MGLGEKGKSRGVFGINSISFPPSRFRTEDRRGGGGQLWRGGAPAALAVAAAGE
jgi:hypothetical protein